MKVGTIYTMDDGELGQYLCLSIFPDKQWAYMVQVSHVPLPDYQGSEFNIHEWQGMNLDLMDHLTRGEYEYPIAMIDTAGWVVIADHQWSELTLESVYSEMGMWKILARLLKNNKLKPFNGG